jgi:hypothetical protein
MTRLIVVVGFLLCVTSTRAQERELAPFGWLAGVWEMTDGPRQVEEHWLSPTANLMVGMSRTVSGGRTTEFEFMRLEKRGPDVFYVPQPGGRPPVAFKLTADDGGRFVFENTSGEDRVTRIEYRRVGEDGLEARVFGARDGKPFTLEYTYRRRK